MDFSQLSILKDRVDLPFSVDSCIVHAGKLAINGKIALPVTRIASSYNAASDISVYDSSGDEIGLLCFTRVIGDVNIFRLTEGQFICYLSEGDYSAIIDEDDLRGVRHNFRHNYLLINETFYNTYCEKYLDTAALWGGFFHPSVDISTVSYTSPVLKIELAELDLIGRQFSENAIRAIQEPYAFERFLKMYHLLELRFDYDVIRKIKSLNIETEPEKIGEVLNSYQRGEVARLDDIIQKNCFDASLLVPHLNRLSEFSDLAGALLYKFGSGKTDNPIKEYESLFGDILNGGFGESNLTSLGVNKNGSYSSFIFRMTRHVIYRIRCSVAHSRIGEFIFKTEDEKFVVEVAEPLLKAVLLQAFRKGTI